MDTANSVRGVTAANDEAKTPEKWMDALPA